MKHTKPEVIASAVSQRVSEGLSELLHKDAGYKELCATVAKESQALFESSASPEQKQLLESYMEKALLVKSVENHFTYMLGISDLDTFKKTVASEAWDSVMLNCTEMFISETQSSPLEPFIADDVPAPRNHYNKSTRRIPLLVAALGMAICFLTGACLPAAFYYITQGDTFTRIASAPIEDPDTLGETTFQSLAEATEYYGLEKVAPTWIPEHYTLKFVGANSENGYTSLYAWYILDSDTQQGLSIRIVSYEQAESMVEKYEMEMEGGEERFASGVRYFLTQNKQNIRAVWVNGNCLCSISGLVSDSEMEKMIKSTKW